MKIEDFAFLETVAKTTFAPRSGVFSLFSGLADRAKLAGLLAAAIEAKLRDAKLSGALPSVETVLKLVGDAYDKYVAPIDIPFIPNIVEPLFDGLIKSLVMDAVRSIYGKILVD